MVEGGKTQSCAKVFDGDRNVSSSVGDCAGNEVGCGMICAGVVELRHLFGVEEIWNIGKCVP